MGNIWSSLVDWFLGTVDVSIFLVGLDGAGKTTLAESLKLYDLKRKKGKQTKDAIMPTVYLNYQEFRKNNVRLKIMDWAGGEKFRKYWYESISSDIDLIVYMVDSTDTDRFEESRLALYQIMKQSHPSVPLMILCNKTDLQGASHDVIMHKLQLNEHQLPDREAGRALSVFHISAKYFDKLDQVIDSITKIAKSEDKAFERTLRKKFLPMVHDPIRSSLLHQWMNVDKTLQRPLTMWEVTKLLHFFQYPAQEKLINKCLSSKKKGVSFNQLATLLKETMDEHQLKEKFEKTKGKSKMMDMEALDTFLQSFDEKIESVEQLVKEKGYAVTEQNKSTIQFHELLLFLYSDENRIVAQPHYLLQEDHMNQPITHYFINTSHFTHLDEHGYASLETYKTLLMNGVRCVDIHCMDGPNKEPVVGSFTNNSVLLKDVIAILKKWAFKYNPYPVIIKLNTASLIKQKNKVKDLFISMMGDHLCRPISKKEPPSPQALQYKFLILSEEDDKLSSIIALPVANEPIWKNQVWDKLTLNQLLHDQPAKIIEHTQNHFGYVNTTLPESFPQLVPYAYGIQMVAQHHGNDDVSSRLNNQLFTLNSNCGYLPQWKHESNSAPISTGLSFELYSAIHLPSTSNATLVSPYIEITVYSMDQQQMVIDKHSKSCFIQRCSTEVVSNNGFNPSWNPRKALKFILEGKNHLFHLKVFSAMDPKCPSPSKDPLLGEFITLTRYIRAGLRSIPLFSINGTRLLGAALLAHISFFKPQTHIVPLPESPNDDIDEPFEYDESNEGNIYIRDICLHGVPQKMKEVSLNVSYPKFSWKTTGNNKDHLVKLKDCHIALRKNIQHQVKLFLSNESGERIGKPIELHLLVNQDESIKQEIFMTKTMTLHLTLSSDINLKPTLKKSTKPFVATINLKHIEQLEGDDQFYIELLDDENTFRTRTLKPSLMPFINETFSFFIKDSSKPIELRVLISGKVSQDQVAYRSTIDVEHHDEPHLHTLSLHAPNEELVWRDQQPVIVFSMETFMNVEPLKGKLTTSIISMNHLDLHEDYLLSFQLNDQEFSMQEDTKSFDVNISNSFTDILNVNLFKNETYGKELYATFALPLVYLNENPFEKLIHFVPLEYQRGEHAFATLRASHDDKHLHLESLVISNVISRNPELDMNVFAKLTLASSKENISLEPQQTNNPSWSLDYSLDLLENDDVCCCEIQVYHATTDELLGSTTFTYAQLLSHDSRTSLLTLPEEIESPSIHLQLTLKQ